ncbi:hypothetical protein MKX01_028928, partial [Papaver californicum]
YAKAWATVNFIGEATMDAKQVIETVKKLFPDEKIVIPCKLLFKMLRAQLSSMMVVAVDMDLR